MNIVKTFSDLAGFLETGGDVLFILLIVSILFWTLIVEKFLYQKLNYRIESKQLRRFWKSHENANTWGDMQLKISQVSRLNISLNSNLSIMRVLIALFPLLGLLGTITGMVNVFDSMSTLGTNAKAMASGISMATIPTMAGMLLAVLGLFAYSQTDAIVKKEIRKLKDKILKDSDA
ncbi:MAG: biopolymer transporter ExbB [Sulfurimonas sp.]|nr:MAG: biopolymer transporter ExbB [Sulfurimonas sp.]